MWNKRTKYKIISVISDKIENKFNIFLSFTFNKFAHAFFKEDIQWFFEKLKKHKAFYHYRKLNQRIPPLIFDGLVLAEDRRFYKHNGIDVRAMIRSVWHCVFMNYCRIKKTKIF